MNTVKYIVIAATLATTGLATINSYGSTSSALEECRDAVKAQYDSPEAHYFYRRPAISTRGDKYTFWINSSAAEGKGKMAVKSRCVTDEQGQVLSLKTARGRWN